jgi:glycosyltransferase involved in cell wall biosynthesis
MYSGNAGFVHDFDAILQAMRMLKDDDRIFFLFAGGGPRRADIEAFAQRERLRNFAYRDYFERDDLASALAVADVHLMSLRRIFAGISVPSKLYGIMAARRATLFIGPRACESANAIIEGDCGAVVDPADPNAATLVTRTILQWLANPAERARLGANAERAFVRDFEMTTNCGSIARLLEERWTGS